MDKAKNPLQTVTLTLLKSDCNMKKFGTRNGPYEVPKTDERLTLHFSEISYKSCKK